MVKKEKKQNFCRWQEVLLTTLLDEFICFTSDVFGSIKVVIHAITSEEIRVSFWSVLVKFRNHGRLKDILSVTIKLCKNSLKTIFFYYRLNLHISYTMNNFIHNIVYGK